MYLIWYDNFVPNKPVLNVVFFRNQSGREPVREWLQELVKGDRKDIGEDIRLVQFRWPLGMPLVRKLEADLWEVRINLELGRIARVFSPFTKMKWPCCMALLRNLRRRHCVNCK